GACRRRPSARAARRHVPPRRRPRPRRPRAPARTAARARDEDRLRARRTHGGARGRRPLHRPHDSRGDRRAVRARPARPRAARRARRPRPPRAADPARLRRQEPADEARRADPGRARRGRRGRPRPVDPRRGGVPMTDLRLVGSQLLPPPPSGPRRHLLSVSDLAREDVERILATAGSFARSQERETKKLPTLRGRVVLNLFFESSTRTSSSFELAAKRLSADTVTVRASGSSVEKGEALKDTALTLSAYEPDVIVLRHPEAGAGQLVARLTDACVVNAGDGKHQHPTQALLDLYTLRETFGRLDELHVAVVGDVLHSRVARSLVQALRLVGSEAILVGPPALLPDGVGPTSHDIDAIRDADVVYVLRMQRERMLEGANFVPSLREYTERYGITAARLRPGQR